MCPRSQTFGPAAFLWADLGRLAPSSVTVPMALITWLALLAALAQYPWSWVPATSTSQLCSVPAASVRALWESAAQATLVEGGQNCAGYPEPPLSKRPSDGSSRRSFSDSTMQVRMTSVSAAWADGEGDEKSDCHVGTSTDEGLRRNSVAKNWLNCRSLCSEVRPNPRQETNPSPYVSMRLDHVQL